MGGGGCGAHDHTAITCPCFLTAVVCSLSDVQPHLPFLHTHTHTLRTSTQAKLYPRILAAMKPGATLGLSHGFLLGVMKNDGVDFRKDINVCLVAPKVGGHAGVCFLGWGGGSGCHGQSECSIWLRMGWGCAAYTYTVCVSGCVCVLCAARLRHTRPILTHNTLAPCPHMRLTVCLPLPPLPSLPPLSLLTTGHGSQCAPPV